LVCDVVHFGGWRQRNWRDILPPARNTGRFIMFFVITNIYNKNTKGSYLNGTVHSHRKAEKYFF